MAVEKVSQEAFQALTLAEQEARGLNHSYIGTEHILLGLIGIPDSQAMKALLALRVSPGMIRAQTAFIVGKGARSPDEQPTLTPRASKVLDLAMEQATRHNRNQVTTIDLLVALLLEG